jgi:AraC-like DNA-binding protein
VVYLSFKNFIVKLEYHPSKISVSESFYVERKKSPYFGVHWHFHEEYEILFTIKGEGVRIVGDHMDHFEDEELVFLGPGLPHLFKNDKNNSESQVDYIVVKFGSILSGINLFSIPEFSLIDRFLKSTSRGILFSKKTIEKVKEKLILLSKSRECEKIIYLISVLQILSTEENINYIASEGFSVSLTNKGEDRTKKVIEYISENYTEDISLDELAEISHMTTNSFCRFFKSRTGKTAFEFLREFRINKACQMLINGEKSIAQICHDSGFNSFSSFNRIFKKLKDISASEYKIKYTDLNN